jgi:hypothetical protein
MPHAVEVGEQAGVVAVAEEVGLLPAFLRLGRLCLLDSLVAGRDQVLLHHLERLAIDPSGHPARDGEERFVGPKALGRQPELQLGNQLMTALAASRKVGEFKEGGGFSATDVVAVK